MAINFPSLGLAAAATGALLGELRVNPLVNLVIGNIILLFALAELGVFNLSVLNPALKGTGKGAIPAFFMVLVSGFIGAACVGPVLGTLLVIAGVVTGVVRTLGKSGRRSRRRSS